MMTVEETELKRTNSAHRQFKSTFELESYLSLPIPVLDRIHLTKFRISNHKLGIEYGRYSGLPLNERLCPKCGELEDEKHFLFTCQLYDTIRGSFISKFPGILGKYVTNDSKFLKVMMSRDP